MVARSWNKGGWVEGTQGKNQWLKSGRTVDEQNTKDNRKEHGWKLGEMVRKRWLGVGKAGTDGYKDQGRQRRVEAQGRGWKIEDGERIVNSEDRVHNGLGIVNEPTQVYGSTPNGIILVFKVISYLKQMYNQGRQLKQSEQICRAAEAEKDLSKRSRKRFVEQKQKKNVEQKQKKTVEQKEKREQKQQKKQHKSRKIPLVMKT